MESISPTHLSNFDLVSAIVKLQNPKFEWNTKHVKGHQDTKKPKDQPLTSLEKVNVELDRMAGEKWQRTHKITARRQKFAYEPWSIWLADEKLVNNFSEQIKDWCQRPRIHRYWIERGRFPESELTFIDTEVTGRTMKTIPQLKRLWIGKHSCGHCAVNKMMVLWKKESETKCPRCDEEIEDATHVWHCQGRDSNTLWENSLDGLEVLMHEHHTDPLLVDIIVSRLNSWRNGTMVEPIAVPPHYQEVLERQDRQGWNNFFLGIPAKGWRELQQANYEASGSTKSGRRWLEAIIRKQWQIAWDIWEYRCNIKHDVKEGTEATHINQQIESLFKDKVSTLPGVKHFFKNGLNAVLEKGIAYKRKWLHRIDTAKARAERKKSPLDQMRRLMRQYVGRG